MKLNLPQDQLNRLNELKENQEEASKDWIDYWFEYSSFDTWQFWVNVSFIIIPLMFSIFLLIKRGYFYWDFSDLIFMCGWSILMP